MMGVLNFIVLTLYTAFNNFYLYELFWGSWPNARTKGFFYLITSLYLLYLIIGEMATYNSNLEYQTSMICKWVLFANFIIFAFTQLNLMPKPIMYLYLLNGSVFAISCIIIISGIRYGTFKN